MTRVSRRQPRHVVAGTPVRIAVIDTRLPHLRPDELQARFHEFNGQFFQGRLPDYSIRVGQSPKANRASGYW